MHCTLKWKYGWKCQKSQHCVCYISILCHTVCVECLSWKWQNPKMNHSKMPILRLSTFDSGAKFNRSFRQFCHPDNSPVPWRQEIKARMLCFWFSFLFNCHFPGTVCPSGNTCQQTTITIWLNPGGSIWKRHICWGWFILSHCFTEKHNWQTTPIQSKLEESSFRIQRKGGVGRCLQMSP